MEKTAADANATTSEESVYIDSNTNADGVAFGNAAQYVPVEEEQRAILCIQQLAGVQEDNIKSCRFNDEALDELRSILDQYLELPSLLDRFIGRMVEELTKGARPLVRLLTSPPLPTTTTTTTTGDNKEEKEDDDSWFWNTPLPRILSALYTLSKVRGRKRVQTLLPHQVDDVEPVLCTLSRLDDLLQRQKRSTQQKQQQQKEEECIGNITTVSSRPPLWESIYSLWNWMGILSKVPFGHSVVMADFQTSKLFDLARMHLSDTGPVRDVTATCLAAWLSRPDLECSSWQTSFQTFARQVLEEYSDSMTSPTTTTTMRRRSTNSLLFATLGVLQTVVTMLKISTSDRKRLLSNVAAPFLVPLTRLQRICSEMTEVASSNILLRKYLVKWWTRVAVLYLPPRIAEWRYQRGHRSLQENLKRSNNDTKGEKEECKVDASGTYPLDEATVEGDDSGTFFLVPDGVEVATGSVIGALKDASTTVRWSAAKGVGRITSRLPSLCAEDVLDAILRLFDDVERDNDWHGACLALAELARRGLLLPRRLQEVVLVIVRAIQYDIPRRQTSVGQHVRDAACYTYWALARAYSPSIMKPFVAQLGQSVVSTFLFDREVNCRRAASAAFQEMVGRQGAHNIPNGIAILTAADFYILGNRKDAYLVIAPQIAEFHEYRQSIVDHLYKIKLSHWDREIRGLSSQSLGRLTSLDPPLIINQVLPYVLENCLNETNLQLRHGSTLGLAEIIMTLGALEGHNQFLSPETLKTIVEIVPTIEKRRLYRGKGGEHMREATCRLIESVAIAKFPVSVPQAVRLLDSIDACLPHPSSVVQKHACKALAALLTNYFPVGRNGPSERLQMRVVDKYSKMVRSSTNPAATRGFTLALGHLPGKLLAPSPEVLDISLSCLCRASQADARVGTEKDAETRRNALLSLSRIVNTVGFHPSSLNGDSNPVVGISAKQMDQVFRAHLCALGDYSIDQRGDVGSMCRSTAMKGLVLLSALASQDVTMEVGQPEFFSTDRCLEIMCLLLKQFSEKLDSIRSEAAACLLEILDDRSPLKMFVLKREELIRALTPVVKIECLDVASTNWANASITFPMAMKAADIDEYFDSIINGLIISVGGLTRSVSESASTALIQWCRAAGEAQLDRLGQVFLQIFDKNKGRGRVILPLLKTLAMLIDRGLMESLIQRESFSSMLLEKLRVEAKTSHVARIAAILNVATCLVNPEASRKVATAFVCEQLMHDFPRIRRLAAEKLYTRLLEIGLDENHPGVCLLLNHPWEANGGDACPSQDFQFVASEISKALSVC